MPNISRLFDYLAGKLARGSEVRGEFDQIINLLNGGLDNDNVAAGANIDQSKIAGLTAEITSLSGRISTNSSRITASDVRISILSGNVPLLSSALHTLSGAHQTLSGAFHTQSGVFTVHAHTGSDGTQKVEHANLNNILGNGSQHISTTLSGAMQNANSPNSGNPFSTMADIPGANTAKYKASKVLATSFPASSTASASWTITPIVKEHVRFDIEGTCGPAAGSLSGTFSICGTVSGIAGGSTIKAFGVVRSDWKKSGVFSGVSNFEVTLTDNTNIQIAAPTQDGILYYVFLRYYAAGKIFTVGTETSVIYGRMETVSHLEEWVDA